MLKWSYYAFTDDFVLASQAPLLQYSPNGSNYAQLRQAEPAIYWHQGLYIGHLDSLIDGMIITDADGGRPMTYGEFDHAIFHNKDFKTASASAIDLFFSFDFVKRPILARVLLAHACLMRLLLFTYSSSPDIDSLIKALRSFAKSDESKKDLGWWLEDDATALQSILGYLETRLGWISPSDYAI